MGGGWICSERNFGPTQKARTGRSFGVSGLWGFLAKDQSLSVQYAVRRDQRCDLPRKVTEYEYEVITETASNYAATHSTISSEDCRIRGKGHSEVTSIFRPDRHRIYGGTC